MIAIPIIIIAALIVVCISIAYLMVLDVLGNIYGIGDQHRIAWKLVASAACVLLVMSTIYAAHVIIALDSITEEESQLDSMK